jgi:hypothetical protein
VVPFWLFFGSILAEKINVEIGNGKDHKSHQKSCFSEEYNHCHSLEKQMFLMV